MSDVGLGFSLQPDAQFLALTEELLEHVDLVELAPETLWRSAPRGAAQAAETAAVGAGGTGDPSPGGHAGGSLSWEPNGYFATCLELARRHGLGCIAHGVGLSLGSVEPSPVRRRAWWRAIAQTQAAFGFRWYTDHLGVSCPAGEELTLPLPLPFDTVHERAVRRALAELRRLVPLVGVENTVTYFSLDEPLAEPAFLGRVLSGSGSCLLLDLHNLWTAAGHGGFDPEAWLDRAPLERVVELHVSGGSWSPPEWLPSGRSLRLDSHDEAVPEEVFALLEQVLPRCPGLRAVTLERMEGTVEEAQLPLLEDELRRLAEVLGRRAPLRALPDDGDRCGAPETTSSPVSPVSAGAVHDAAQDAALDAAQDAALDAALDVERRLVSLLRAPDPEAALAALLSDPQLSPAARRALARVDGDGLRLASLLVARLRFERLVQGAPDGAALFTEDRAGFTEDFRRYHASQPSLSLAPEDEWQAFAHWRQRAPARDRPG